METLLGGKSGRIKLVLSIGDGTVACALGIATLRLILRDNGREIDFGIRGILIDGEQLVLTAHLGFISGARCVTLGIINFGWW